MHAYRHRAVVPVQVQTSGITMPPKPALKSVTAKTAKSAGELMLADLARSGLESKDIKKMGCAALTPAETAKLTNDKFHVSSYLLPYYGARGEESGFYRLRFLADVTLPGEKKKIRYWQPPGTLPKVYFPRVGVTKWDKLLADTSKPIYITEGEKKAARATASGIPTLGLGGVWSWRSSKFGKLLLDDLEQVEWGGREVVIVFDSDLAENPDVQAALSQLGRVLLDRGAVVSSLCLTPLDDGGKAGLDDWLEARGADAFKELEPEPLSESVELWRLNDEVALIRENGGIVELSSGNVYSKSAFCEVIFANRRFVRVTGEGKLRECSAPDEWLRWQHRREYNAITYAPGDGIVTSRNELNTWKGWGAVPKKGDIKPFMDVFDYVTQSLTPDVKRWLLQWMAYPVQHPGTKMYSSVLLWGRVHGVGKSFVPIMLGKVYGANFGMIGQQDLVSDFNDWGKGKQFVLGEEVTSSERRRDSDLLKFMTTRDVVRINEKYQPKYTLPDVTNYFFTSNHPDAFFVEPSDRRLLIFEAPNTPAPQKVYDAAEVWHKSEAGPAALLHYLLHDVDCRGFNPRGHAPLTQEKQAMIDLSASDLDLFARALMADPEGTLGVLGARSGVCDLYTAEELMEVFDPGQQRRTTKIAMAKALRRAGAEPMPSTTIKRLGTRQLWAVRNELAWKTQDHGARAAHYEGAVGLLRREAPEKKPAKARETKMDAKRKELIASGKARNTREANTIIAKGTGKKGGRK